MLSLQPDLNNIDQLAANTGSIRLALWGNPESVNLTLAVKSNAVPNQDNEQIVTSILNTPFQTEHRKIGRFQGEKDNNLHRIIKLADIPLPDKCKYITKKVADRYTFQGEIRIEVALREPHEAELFSNETVMYTMQEIENTTGFDKAKIKTRDRIAVLSFPAAELESALDCFQDLQRRREEVLENGLYQQTSNTEICHLIAKNFTDFRDIDIIFFDALTQAIGDQKAEIEKLKPLLFENNLRPFQLAAEIITLHYNEQPVSSELVEKYTASLQ